MWDSCRDIVGDVPTVFIMHALDFARADDPSCVSVDIPAAGATGCVSPHIIRVTRCDGRQIVPFFEVTGVGTGPDVAEITALDWDPSCACNEGTGDFVINPTLDSTMSSWVQTDNRGSMYYAFGGREVTYRATFCAER